VRRGISSSPISAPPCAGRQPCNRDATDL
jgi:hypothetical protein